MANNWLVRSGEGGRLVSEFEKGFVAIGFGLHDNDLSKATSKADLLSAYHKVHPAAKPGPVHSDIGQYWRFVHELKVGDNVLTYDGSAREYLIGEISGDYKHVPDPKNGLPHRRDAKWKGRLSRDKLSVSARNSLGSALTLFSVSSDVWAEILQASSGNSPNRTIEPEEEDTQLDQLYADTVERAHELLKDRILALDPDEMEVLVAEILKAMGYKARVTPKGPDRGVDVYASKDGLGFEEPRIKAEVKHRSKSQMGSQDLRSFIAGLRQGDRGMYVSTGGFTKEAKYEAERATIPVGLVDLDELANLVVANYESFDFRGRTLMRLTKVYWPVD